MGEYQNIRDSYYDVPKSYFVLDEKTGRYGPILSPLYVEGILNDHYTDNSKLLDIGCGLGNILKLGNEIGFNSTGIEINEDLSKYHEGLNVIYGDVLNMDLSFMVDFDIIYTFRIFIDERKCNDLLQKIYENMKHNATIIFILPHTIDDNIHDPYRLFEKFIITEYKNLKNRDITLRKNILTV